MRPADVALVLRDRYDPDHIHEIDEWAAIATAAVACVTAAREIMDLLPPDPLILV